MDTPFSVEYKIDKVNRDTFMVQQDRNIGKHCRIKVVMNSLT